MGNVIVVTEEELIDLVFYPPHKDKWYRDIEEAKWKERLEQSKEPIYLGKSEDGLAIYELKFTL